MKTAIRGSKATSAGGYMLLECLAYIGVVVILLGVAYAAMYKSINASVALRRNADDVTSAIHAGERWRADVRSASSAEPWQGMFGERGLLLKTAKGDIRYRFSEGRVYRQVKDQGWARLLDNVRSSSMTLEPRQKVTGWRWELELQPRNPAGHLKPLFTFEAVPQAPTVS